MAEEIPGYSSRVSLAGHRIIALHYRADPAKRSPEWARRARLESASDADYMRELELNWDITGGAAVFPEFAKNGAERYLYEPRETLALPVLRGWDLGERAPGVIWMQYAAASDRLYILREWFPRGIATHWLRDVAKWCSGQMDYGLLDPKAQEWADLLSRLPGTPKPPWFAKGTEFMDFAGPEANYVQSIASRNPTEATQRAVFSAGGVELQIAPKSGPAARAVVLRRLLHMRPDGWPGILISPSCTETLAMFNGGLAWKKPTGINPKPAEVRKDGHFDDVHDALGYAVIQVVPSEGVPGITLPSVLQYETEDLIGWSTD